jgi:transposase InsO family protein
LFSVITPSERFNDQREMDKGAEHHIDLRVCVTLASSVGVTTSSPPRRRAGLDLVRAQSGLGTTSVLRSTIKAVLRRPVEPGQYASDSYRKLIKQFRMTQSMSRKGNCWDNAPMESFFKTLKVEHTYRLRYTSREQARLDIVNWTEGFYNEMRMHSALDYRSPVDFERDLRAA